MQNRIPVGEIQLIGSTFHYNWVIKNFQMQYFDVESAVHSPTFSSNIDGEEDFQYKWRITLIPVNKGNTFFSIHLNNVSDRDVLAKSKLTINSFILSDEPLQMKIVKNKFHINESKKFTILNSTSFLISRKLLTENAILRNASFYIPNNTLTINCEISVFENINENKKKRTQNVYSLMNALTNDLEQLMTQKDFCDITFSIADKTIRAHKNILAMKSTVFQAMFKNEMKEKIESHVKIVDVRPEVFEELLRYIYCRKINCIENIASELLVAADKYALDGLVNMCGDALAEDLSISVLIDRYNLAQQFNVKILREQIIKFVIDNVNEVIDHPEFLQLPNDIIKDAFRIAVKNSFCY